MLKYLFLVKNFTVLCEALSLLCGVMELAVILEVSGGLAPSGRNSACEK